MWSVFVLVFLSLLSLRFLSGCQRRCFILRGLTLVLRQRVERDTYLCACRPLPEHLLFGTIHPTKQIPRSVGHPRNMGGGLNFFCRRRSSSIGRVDLTRGADFVLNCCQAR
ncbi:hypothetical protein C8F04DRAFT_1078502 [Mycena alexandri]|uniref:Secreted protein n=1 Tax=Mycena alexandri TaxID=1745969 RepID=A0AAD6T9M6_9AGAR|nr:hypothetical protein C8F04DRAFT_1078502 [Mycena alexandri]